VQDELAREQPTAARLPLAAAGGVLGGGLAAVVWTAIAVLAGVEIGYLAILVGYLSGVGVKLGAQGARGKPLQLLAVGCSLVGLVAAKYFLFGHALNEHLVKTGASALSLLDPRVAGSFVEFLPELLSPFDLLWVALAFGAAYRVPRPTSLVTA
jgi:hypothetical protein